MPKKIKIVEVAAADEEIATTFPAEFNKIIKERKYDPRQVFNYDETGLFWKKLPIRTYMHKSANRRQDRLRKRKYTVNVQCSVLSRALYYYLI
jgi:hypothetical protein